ncbi:hypothetical protein GCM10015535_68450 [Streptomyces gelaticus]|uniref:Uncharacterized protein n=1 Tax=Streptomyces gelaticus TaxID=285446 RepID=A0ABQ2W9M1_9ACTN|nr:hypothetical protein GCM10015535_68450 [Streptomyces gelaticus]
MVAAADDGLRVRDHFADDFHSLLWDRPDVRKRWILRARNENSVREVADALAWDVAVSLDRILPTDTLGPSIQGAVLNDFADAIDLNAKTGAHADDKRHLYLLSPVAACGQPRAGALVGEIGQDRDALALADPVGTGRGEVVGAAGQHG